MTRLLICDDSSEARAALKTMLADEPEIEIVGEAANGREAVTSAVALSPDCILMDVLMPIVDGIEATREIRSLLPAARIVAFAGSAESEIVSAMLEAGANSYCVKGAPLWELTRAIAGSSDPVVRLAQTLAKGVNGYSAAQIVARELTEVTGGAMTAVYVAAADVALSLSGLCGFSSDARLVSAPGIAVRAFRAASPVRADSVELAELAEFGAACSDAIAVPLASDGETLGALLVAVPGNRALELDTELVFAIADLAATTVQTERTMALTFAEARRDARTGLPNRRAFDERVAADLAGGRSISLVLFDLDRFKEVNDSEGHAAGDDALREVARVTQRKLRADEDVYRLGGDEFGVLIDGGSEAAERVATRLRGAVLAHRRSRALPSMSAGIATVPTDAESAEELLRKADLALYAAKGAGGNQVVLYSGALGDSGQEGRVPPTNDQQPEESSSPRRLERVVEISAGPRARLLVVDDDAQLRTLLRTTLESTDAEIAEAGSAAEARESIALRAPQLVVLDVGLPDMDGLRLCRELKAIDETKNIAVLVLTGNDAGTERAASEAGADAFLRKPFSPLDLVALVGRLLGGLYDGPVKTPEPRPGGQLLIYAQDLRRLLEVEQGQRLLVQQAYQQTVVALAAALESKDTGTGAHSQRVQRYASELTSALKPALLTDRSLEYGFLLHDVGKISIPDKVLLKPGALTPSERRLLQTHTVLGEQMLSGVSILRGEGLKVVRSHHERWDGRGYPDGLAGNEIPLAARVFAVADTLDAMTTNRPYRPAGRWDQAMQEIVAERGSQFDPDVVDALLDVEPKLRRVYYEFTAAGNVPDARSLARTEA
ncbi:MAG: response regulator [Actinobacteria bacterium]|nr:MAG: response regulator [Actinomycetota bacterium]